MRKLLAILPLLASAVAVLHYRADHERRAAGEAFITRFTIEERRPAIAERARNTQTFDAMNLELANAAVEDSLGVVNFRSLDDDERRRWIAAVAKFDDELLAARDLSLDAIAARPGWPAHQAALGRAEYVAQQRGVVDRNAQQRGNESDRWFRPLVRAAAGAPGNDAIATFLGGALLEQSGLLPPHAQRELAPRLARAFASPSFTRRAFLPAASIAGEANALALLPDEAASLEQALNAVEREKLAGLAQQLFPRWEQAERKARVADLAKLEERAARNDLDRLRRDAPSWLRVHPPSEFGDAASIAQVARVLDLVPQGVAGSWPGDPRAEAMRILMADGGEHGSVLLDTATSLDNLPEPLLARALVAAGDSSAASELQRESPSAGAFEWTAMLVDLAEAKRRAGRLEEATSAYLAIAPGARDECDVLLLRRRLAESGVRRVGTKEEIDAMLAASLPPEFGPAWWSPSHRLSLCVDRRQLAPEGGAAPGRLQVTVTTDQQTLLDYGWDDVRLQTLALGSGAATFVVPLPTGEGRHTLYLKSRIPGVKLTSPTARTTRRSAT